MALRVSSAFSSNQVKKTFQCGSKRIRVLTTILITILIFFQIFIVFHSDKLEKRSNEKKEGRLLYPIKHSNKERNYMEGNTNSEKTDDDVAIFYNLFIPDNYSKMFYKQQAPATIEQVQEITEEQLTYRKNSIYPNAKLYYISSGKNIGPIKNCHNCIQIEHKHVGNELQTLRELHNFCSKNEPNKNKDVIYIHNKGSFHPSHQNNLMRRMLTKSVFSKECLLDRFHIPDSSCKCNVCSARFSPIPHFHTPGNMWVASCSYISKLLPPDRFGLHMDDALKTAPQSQFGNAKKLAITHVGRGRFSAEHWVHSHPDNCPCDVYAGPYIWAYERLPINDDWEPNLQKAPRFPFVGDYAAEEYFQGVRKTKEGNWFSLPGRIHEWKTLYNSVPDDTNWVWSYYARSEIYSK